MKKRVIISLIVVCLIIISILLVNYRIMKIRTEEENRPGSFSSNSTQVKFFPGNEYNSPLGDIHELVDGYCYEVELNCYVTDGAMIFMIYDTNGYDRGREDDYTFLSQERIDATGDYIYDLTYLPLGSYYFYICPEDDQTVAGAKYTFKITRID